MSPILLGQSPPQKGWQLHGGGRGIQNEVQGLNFKVAQGGALLARSEVWVSPVNN